VRLRRELYGLKSPILLAALLMLGCSQPAKTPTVPDGLWRVVTIDGQPAKNQRMTIDIRNGAIVGGHDGCNQWNHITGEDGKPMIMSTCVGCSDKDPELRAYGSFQNPKTPAIVLKMVNGQLVAEAGSHQFLAVK
jgi:hypothetical protein